jgi:hypothetical protein
MSYYFNGVVYETPTTVSAINDDAMVPAGVSTQNVPCLVGLSAGGQPNVALTFTDPKVAKSTLVSGELLQAVLRAFSPSDETGGPAKVVAMRVNPALQASLVLNDAQSDPVINLVSNDYGLLTNKIKVSIDAGSTQGLKVSVAQGSATAYTKDNLYASPFSLQYTGQAASATIGITNSTVILSAPSGSPVATIDLNTFATIQELVDSINMVPGFAAIETSGFEEAPSLNGLDAVTAQDVKTSEYNVLANLQAVIDWFNGSAQPLVSATRVANAGTPPAPIAYTFLTGGLDGVTTTSSWSDTFDALQTVDVQWITPVTSNPTVHAMVDAHVQYMSTTGRKERRAVCGTPLSTSDDVALTLAKQINSDRTSLVHLGHYAYDLTGALSGLQLYPPYQSAAAITGAFAAVAPGEPLTNKTLKFAGLERDLLVPANTDPLILGGVLCLENTDEGYKVVKSISTWLADKKYDKVEQSVGFACDFIARTVRTNLDVLRGGKNSPLRLGRAVQITETTLRALAVAEPNGPGVIVGDADSPAYTGITATMVGDAIAVSFQCSPVLPTNYVGITIYVVPFSGTASA